MARHFIRMTVIAAGLIVTSASAGGQTRPDGVFVAASPVWKSVAAREQWQRAATQTTRPRDGLLACEVESGTPFVVHFAIPPHGFGIEIADGPHKGCQGVATTGSVTLYESTTSQAPKGSAQRSAPAPPPAASGAPVRVPGTPPIRPMVPPLPPGGALPIKPGLR